MMNNASALMQKMTQKSKKTCQETAGLFILIFKKIKNENYN